ncbi:MAG: hypothetical protein AcusKO_07000 [Acuticoccus sp.]
MIDFVKRPAPSTDHMSDYDRNSSVQDKMIRFRSSKIAALAAGLPRAADGTLVIQDYGCGPGHSALDAVRPAIDALREAAPDAPIVVRHSDQPGNDWNALLHLVFGENGYHHLGNIRTETAVGSFYDPLAAPGSVSLATSFAASHWLSRVERPYSPGTVSFDNLEGEALTVVRDLAHADWARFLARRAAELMEGGVLVVGTLGSMPDAAAPNGFRAAGARFIRAFEAVAETMVADGLLSRDRLDHFVLPYWFLTIEEATAPLRNGSNLARAFEVVEATLSLVEAAHNEIYGATFDDPVDYGRRTAGYVRGFTESTMRLHLFADDAASAAEMDARIDEFFRRYAAHIPGASGPAELFNSLLILRRR